MKDAIGFLIFNGYALIILIIISAVFFSKKRLHQFEDNLYAGFLISILSVSISGIILGIALQIDIPYFILFLLNKIYLNCIEVWILILTFYIYVITHENSDYRKIKKGFIWAGIVILLVISFMPITITMTDGAASTTGIGVDVTYGIFTLSILFEILCLIKNFKKEMIKKYIPVISLFVVMILILGLMLYDPSFNYIINPALALITYITYHTIENPDMKMLEEVHKAKEITDNANEEKAMFLYNMTNDIRDITRDIEYSADAILDETDNKKVDIESVNNNARDIKASAARFTTMTNEILDVSSIDTANIKVYNDKYNIKLIIKELVQIYKSKAERKGLEFRTTIASDLPEYLYGDPVGVKTTLATILDNSVKYTEEGYVEFNVNAIMKNNIARLIISVEDSGYGMKADELNKIFNKRGEDKESTNLKSNLYNAKKLVTLMGGTIIPSSIYGKGTIIKVVLDQKVGETSDNLNKYEKVLDKKKILLVDDNTSSTKMITKLLKESNTILESVSSGKECLDKIRNKEKYDLILLDEEMTPLDGKAVMKKLGEIRNFNTNVILLTKNNDYEYNEDYLKYGFKDYLIKPVDKDKLLEKINKYSKENIDFYINERYNLLINL